MARMTLQLNRIIWCGSILTKIICTLDSSNHRLFVSNVKTGRNTHSDYFAKSGATTGAIAITVYITGSTIIVLTGSDILDLNRIILTFTDEDVRFVKGVNINRLDTYSVAVSSFVIFQ